MFVLESTLSLTVNAQCCYKVKVSGSVPYPKPTEQWKLSYREPVSFCPLICTTKTHMLVRVASQGAILTSTPILFPHNMSSSWSKFSTKPVTILWIAVLFRHWGQPPSGRPSHASSRCACTCMYNNDTLEDRGDCLQVFKYKWWQVRLFYIPKIMVHLSISIWYPWDTAEGHICIWEINVCMSFLRCVSGMFRPALEKL